MTQVRRGDVGIFGVRLWGVEFEGGMCGGWMCVN